MIIPNIAILLQIITFNLYIYWARAKRSLNFVDLRKTSRKLRSNSLNFLLHGPFEEIIPFPTLYQVEPKLMLYEKFGGEKREMVLRINALSHGSGILR